MGLKFKSHHLIWIIVLLVFALVGMIVAKPNSEYLYNYIAFAAAISSILLAVITIIFTMISNRGFDTTLSEIRASAAQVAAETSNLGQASRGLSKEAEDAIERLSNLPAEITTMSGKLEKKIESATFSGGRHPNLDVKAGKFKAAGKPVGVVSALYLIHMMEKKSLSIAVRDIFDKHKFMEDYMIGFLDSYKYFNPCGTVIDKAGSSFSLEKMGSLSLGDVVESIENPEGVSKEAMAVINEIRAYFSEEPIEYPTDEDSTEGDDEDSALADSDVAKE